jgi:hypothetical protein
MSDATEKTLETIDRYLGGTMEMTERLQFEQEVSQNASLKSLVEASKSVQELLIDHKTVMFKAKFSSLLQQEKTKKKWRYTGLGIVVGIGLLGIGAYQFTGTQNTDTGRQGPEEFTKTTSLDSPKAVTKNAKTEQPLPITKPQNNKVNTSVNISKDTNTQSSPIVHHGEEISTSGQKREDTKKTAEKVEPANNTPQIFDCSGTMITFTPRSTATCKGQDEGSISISEIGKGGTAPYYWSVDGEQKSPQETADHLPAGDYWVVMNDQNGCSRKMRVTIATKNCIETREYSLDPYASNKLSWGQADKAITLNIHHKSGKLVYKQNFENGDTMEWEGRDQEGNILANGVYLYSIIQGTELQEKGYITIVNSH